MSSQAKLLPEPTAEALAKSAERLERGREHAQTFIAQAFEDSKNMARALITELMMQLLDSVEFALLAGHSGDHYEAVQLGFHHIAYCLELLGPGVSVCAAEALDAIGVDTYHDGCIGHVSFFKDAGLQALLTNCVRTIQDAIGLGMVRDGDMELVMRLETISQVTKSRLRSAYLIQKRYLRDVGTHMMEFGKELPSDHEPKWAKRGPKKAAKAAAIAAAGSAAPAR